ncbi:MAG: FGGY-family carbohydrate kinase [Spirochaetales bacterium]
MKLMAVDVGTQSLKASIYDEDLRCLAQERERYQPVTHSGNCVEIDAGIFWEALQKVCTRLPMEDVEGIAFSTLCPSLVVMDRQGEPLHPVILHLDRRSQKQAEWILQVVGMERFRSITGNPPIPGGMSVTSMLWLQENVPLPEDSVFGHVETYLVKKLTGNFCIDPSNASFTGLYETLAYGDWSVELTEALGIPKSRLPEVRDSLSVAGTLRPEAADALGLRSGIPVILGANDTTCSVAGAGIREPGRLLNTSGTVEILVLCTDTPITSSNFLIRTHAYRNRWLLMRTLGAGGASIEWFRKNFYPDLSYEHFYSVHIEEVLKRTDPPSIVFEPYLTGDRHRVEPLKASFSNITIDSSRDDFLYALCYYNIQFIASVLPEWESSCPLERRIYHVGGGANEGYTSLKQRLMAEYEFIPIGQTAARGAALLGFETLGLSIDPQRIDPEGKQDGEL